MIGTESEQIGTEIKTGIEKKKLMISTAPIDHINVIDPTIISTTEGIIRALLAFLYFGELLSCELIFLFSSS